MNGRLNEQLQEARLHLQRCQRLVYAARQRHLWTNPDAAYVDAVRRLYLALDRAWEAQCMAQGSF